MENKKQTGENPDGMMSREELEDWMEKHQDIPEVEMYINGKEVFPDSRHYDAYSNAAGVRILQYSNGKPAGYTDSAETRYKIIF